MVFNVDRRSRLAEFAHVGTVVRDSEFFGVGKIPTQIFARLVPVQSADFLPLALATPGVTAIICPPGLADQIPDAIGCIATDDPQGAAYSIHCDLAERENYFWTGFETRIATSARIHPSAEIASRDVVINEDVIVAAGAVIGERTVLGSGCTVGPRSLIGTPAFELQRSEGHNRLRRQVGGVRIGSNTIFLGAAVVSRSVFPTFTEIGSGCSFDTMVQVAHDCHLADDVSIACGAMLMGRVTVGPGVYVGPNATVSNGLTIGEGASISLGATVVKDVKARQKVSGNFAIEHAIFVRNLKRSVHEN